MKNPLIIEFLDKKGKVISMNYYLSVQDFITENKDRTHTGIQAMPRKRN